MSRVYYFLILHSQLRAQNKFGTVAGCVDSSLFWLVKMLKNNPITWTCPVKMTRKPKACLDIVCWPAIILSKWKKERTQRFFLPSSIFSSFACVSSLWTAVQSFCVLSYCLIKQVGLELLVADILQNSSTFFIHSGEEIKAFFTESYFFLGPQPAK